LKRRHSNDVETQEKQKKKKRTAATANHNKYSIYLLYVYTEKKDQIKSIIFTYEKDS